MSTGREGTAPTSEQWNRYTDEIVAPGDRLRDIPADDRATWAHVAHDVAGAFAG